MAVFFIYTSGEVSDVCILLRVGPGTSGCPALELWNMDELLVACAPLPDVHSSPRAFQ